MDHEEHLPPPPWAPTLGQRLDEQARRIAARRLPAYPWARPLARLLDHLSALPGPAQGRFDRIEAPVREPALAARGSERRGELPAIYAPPPAPGRPLAPEVQARLREDVGPGAETLRVHDDKAADAAAAGQRADAVTMGQDVFFREGQFRPQEPAGYGLLAHEATHVVALLQPGASWRRATSAGIREEEAEAEAHERRAAAGEGRLDGTRSPRAVERGAAFAPGAPHRDAPVTGSAAGAAPKGHGSAGPSWAGDTPASGNAAASPALQPMRAATGRKSEPAPPAPAIDLEDMRRTLMRDLMRQLRSEFERGG